MDKTKRKGANDDNYRNSYDRIFGQRNSSSTKIQILEEEVEYYRTLIQQRPHRRRPHDCGHIRTTISFLEKRIKNLAGDKGEFPFF